MVMFAGAIHVLQVKQENQLLSKKLYVILVGGKRCKMNMMHRSVMVLGTWYPIKKALILLIANGCGRSREGQMVQLIDTRAD
jgi:hypothetical protein